MGHEQEQEQERVHLIFSQATTVYIPDHVTFQYTSEINVSVNDNLDNLVFYLCHTRTHTQPSLLKALLVCT